MPGADFLSFVGWPPARTLKLPTKRTVIDRPRRRVFSAETLALFQELEAVPLRRRSGEDLRDQERELAEKLDLADEFWTTNSVLDRSAAPCWPPWLVAYGDWHRCRAIRLQLLAAAREAGRQMSQLTGSDETGGKR
jgi:hypothetical protein